MTKDRASDSSYRVRQVVLAPQPERPVLVVTTDEQLGERLAAGRVRISERSR